MQIRHSILSSARYQWYWQALSTKRRYQEAFRYGESNSWIFVSAIDKEANTAPREISPLTELINDNSDRQKKPLFTLRICCSFRWNKEHSKQHCYNFCHVHTCTQNGNDYQTPTGILASINNGGAIRVKPTHWTSMMGQWVDVNAKVNPFSTRYGFAAQS